MKELKELLNNQFKLTNLQLFSDGENNVGGEPDPTIGEPTVKKKDFDKVAGELARLKKEQKEKMTLDQQKELEMSEKDNKIIELENQIKKATLKSGLSVIGIDAKQVDSITNSILEGDTESIVKSITKVFEDVDSKHKQELEAVKLDLTPRPAVGSNGDGNTEEVTQEMFNNMSYLEKYELKEKNPELFKKLMK